MIVAFTKRHEEALVKFVQKNKNMSVEEKKAQMNKFYGKYA